MRGPWRVGVEVGEVGRPQLPGVSGAGKGRACSRVYLGALNPRTERQCLLSFSGFVEFWKPLEGLGGGQNTKPGAATPHISSRDATRDGISDLECCELNICWTFPEDFLSNPLT